MFQNAPCNIPSNMQYAILQYCNILYMYVAYCIQNYVSTSAFNNTLQKIQRNVEFLTYSTNQSSYYFHVGMMTWKEILPFTFIFFFTYYNYKVYKDIIGKVLRSLHFLNPLLAKGQIICFVQVVFSISKIMAKQNYFKGTSRLCYLSVVTTMQMLNVTYPRQLVIYYMLLYWLI